MEENTPQLNMQGDGMVNITKPIKIFKYKKKAIFLIIAGIVGIILSIIYYKMSVTGCPDSLIDNLCSDKDLINNKITTSYQTSYYLFVAIIVFIAGIFLYKKKKIGLYLFLVSVSMIIFSIFLPKDLTHIYKIVFNSNNLFLNSIITATAFGFIFFPVLIGLYFYFFAIFFNLFSIKKWAYLFNINTSKLWFFCLKMIGFYFILFEVINIFRKLIYLAL